MLNYGHTFAHAFETVAGYGTWLHGEAVAAGMICAGRLAERRGLVDRDFTQRLQRLLMGLRLPTKPDRWPLDPILASMRNDKKAVAGRLRFVLPRQLGEVALFDDIPESEVRHVLEELCT
jgi:3-dehydroquinate synthase